MSIRIALFLLAGLLPAAFQAHAVSLSPSSLTMSPGQVATVNATNIRGTLTISRNSSPSVASAVLSAPKITITALKGGSTTVTVRDRSGSKSLRVNVTAPPMAVSPTAISLSVGQSANVSVSNPNGSVRATSSNSSVATAILSNNVVTVQGKAAGSATITIRDSRISKKVDVTVTSNGGGGGGGGATNTQGRLLASQCFQCHNAKGGSTGFDRITGESVNEIVGEMKEMQAKAASKPEIMHSQAMIYTDAEIYALAQYLASLSGSASSRSSNKNDRDDD